MRELRADESDGIEAETGKQAASTTFGTPFDLNLIGLWTLYLKEVRRFLKVPLRPSAKVTVTSSPWRLWALVTT